MSEQKEPSVKNLLEIFSIALISFIGILMTTATNINFPEFVKFFDTPLFNVQWISTGAMITSAVTMVCSAYLDKRFNDKTVFLSSITALLLSLIICAVTSNFSIFLIGRLLGGFSIGTCTPLMFNVIPKLVSSNKIGFYMAVGATVLAVGPSLGPTYGGFVNYYLSWRMIFLLVIPVVILVAILGTFSISNHLPINNKISFDWTGLVLILIAFSTLAIGFNSLSSFSIVTIITFLIGIVTIWLFLRHGNHNDSAILNTKVLKHHQFALDVLAYFLVQFTNISLSSLLIPNFTQVAIGVTSLVAGLTLLPGNVFRMIGTPIGGSLLDKHGAKVPIYTGLIVMTVYFALMAVIDKQLTETEILLAYIVYNCGFALAFSNILTNGLRSLPNKVKGDGNAIFNAVQVYGGAIGICILSLIISLVQKSKVNVAQSLMMRNSGQWCFIFLTIITLIALVSVHRGFNENS